MASASWWLHPHYVLTCFVGGSIRRPQSCQLIGSLIATTFPFPFKQVTQAKKYHHFVLAWLFLDECELTAFTPQLVFIKDFCKKWVDVSVILGIVARLMGLQVSNSFHSKLASCPALKAMPREVSDITGSESTLQFFFSWSLVSKTNILWNQCIQK